MSKSSKITKCLYIDLSNLYGGMSELLPPGDYFDFSTLMPLLDNEFGGIDKFKVYGAFMGLGGAKSRNEELFIKAQNEFINSTLLKGVHFGKGSISRHKQEKGVDMQLGIDMVNDAHLGNYTDVILMSEDADFSYPVAIIKDMKLNFHYCGFATRYSNYLAWQSWKKIVLDYNNYFSSKVLPSIRPPKNLKICHLDKEKVLQIKSVK